MHVAYYILPRKAAKFLQFRKISCNFLIRSSGAVGLILR